jgi:hypothetical protein
MKTDQQLYNEFRGKNGNARLYPEEQILKLMEKARIEERTDFKERIPKIETLKKLFKEEFEAVKKNETKRACYNGLSQNQLFWVWFAQGAAAVIRKLK